MMNYLRFDYEEIGLHLQKMIFSFGLMSCAALFMTACSTTQPTRPPVMEAPVIEDVVEETEKKDEKKDETEAKDKEDDAKEDKDHMEGRNVKRLALLLPFSSRSTRLREEAASMMKAAELSIFDRDEADVVLFSLDTGGTRA